MKTLIGIDLGGKHKPAMNACLDLNFKANELLLLHSVEVLPLYAPPMQHMALDTTKWLEHLRESADEALKEATRQIEARGQRARSIMVDGSPAANLLEIAEKEDVDLIVVGSVRSASLMGLLIGSVGRALAIGSKQSLLIVKSEEPADPITHALFASDGSPYAQKCFEALLQWAPTGLKRIDVVRAVDFLHHEQEIEELKSSMMLADAQRVILSRCEEEVNTLCESLRSAGYLSDPVVRAGYPRCVLSEEMEARGAELMIVGAQGHGFLRRLLIGSVSLHQVFSEKYPVLLLRMD